MIHSKGNVFIVIRKPCLMEDEGRYHVECCFSNRDLAENWVRQQFNQYFKPTDYEIATCPLDE